MRKMKTIYIVLTAMMLFTSCDNDLEQTPALDLESSNLEVYNEFWFFSGRI